jgi:hypothetical protein
MHGQHDNIIRIRLGKEHCHPLLKHGPASAADFAKLVLVLCLMHYSTHRAEYDYFDDGRRYRMAGFVSRLGWTRRWSEWIYKDQDGLV